MKRCGLLGEKLGHSYSPAIHAELADYEYRLYEVAPEKLGEFLTGGGFDGMNVTIPYKKAVIPYCAELSPIAQKLQSVNVLVRREDGTLYGDNTDAYGFARAWSERAAFDIDGQKGARAGQRRSLRHGMRRARGAGRAKRCRHLPQAGRTTTNNLRSSRGRGDHREHHARGHVPEQRRRRPSTCRVFPKLRGCAGYRLQPARARRFVLQAEELGIPCMGGLNMLVAQAKRAAEVFSPAQSYPTAEHASETRARAKPEYAKHRAHRHAGLRQEHRSRGAGQEA